MKRILVVFAALVVAVAFTGCNSYDDRLSKEKIFDLVQENLNTLLADVAKDDFTATRALKGIRQVNQQDNGVIDFDCGGQGFGPSTHYCGFYYSASDDIAGIWCASPPEEIEADQSGWSYQQKDGDNTYYTEKIADHFFYYEASF